MPRKYWKPKNRYFKASKLSEDAFIGLLKCYLEMQSAKNSAEYLKQENGTKISRQSVTNYFLKFGKYLFYEFFIFHVGMSNISMNLINPEIEVANGFLEISNNKSLMTFPRFKFLKQYRYGNKDTSSAESIVAHCIAYAMQYQSFIYKEEISEGDGVITLPDNRMIISLIRHDISVAKGLENDSFAYHFGRAYFIDTIIGAYFPEVQKQYAGRDIELFQREDIQVQLLSSFLNLLNKNPL